MTEARARKLELRLNAILRRRLGSPRVTDLGEILAIKNELERAVATTMYADNTKGNTSSESQSN